MSGLGFANLTPWLAVLAAGLTALTVLFYFLKLRRPRAEVPSLALWRRVVNDRRVNSPFQRFRKNLLLLLQLALLAALLLALAQPFLTSGADRAEYRVLLVDTSASMAATDAGGTSRLDAAKAEAATLVDGLLPGQRLAVVAFDRSARPLTEFTDNPRLLAAAVDSLAVRDMESDLADALRVAGAGPHGPRQRGGHPVGRERAAGGGRGPRLPRQLPAAAAGGAERGRDGLQRPPQRGR